MGAPALLSGAELDRQVRNWTRMASASAIVAACGLLERLAGSPTGLPGFLVWTAVAVAAGFSLYAAKRLQEFYGGRRRRDDSWSGDDPPPGHPTLHHDRADD